MLYQAFLLIDSFTCDGAAQQDHEAKGARIKTLVEEALTGLPRWKQDELEWLSATARAFAILGKGVRRKDDPRATEDLRKEFGALMSRSPAFEGFAPYAEAKFTMYVNWLTEGWNQTLF